MPPHTRPDRPPCRPPSPRRLLRQPRHRHADARGQHIPEGVEVLLQSENGILGSANFRSEEEVDPD